MWSQNHTREKENNTVRVGGCKIRRPSSFIQAHKKKKENNDAQPTSRLKSPCLSESLYMFRSGAGPPASCSPPSSPSSALGPLPSSARGPHTPRPGRPPLTPALVLWCRIPFPLLNPLPLSRCPFPPRRACFPPWAVRNSSRAKKVNVTLHFFNINNFLSAVLKSLSHVKTEFPMCFFFFFPNSWHKLPPWSI